MDHLEEVGTTSQGYTIFREQNKAGGYTYWSDEAGDGVVVWDTSLVNTETLRYVLFLHEHLPQE